VRILVIENELHLAGAMTRTLARSGHSLSAERDSASGLRDALAHRHDLIVLNLKALHGQRALHQLRRVCATSRVLMIRDPAESIRPLAGPPSNTSDYLATPFAMGELVNRVEALGRRTPVTCGVRLRAADLTMDLRRRRVTRAGRPIALSPREFSLLEILLREPGRTFSRAELCERIWQRDHAYGSRTVEMFVSRLRRKVDSGFAMPLIHTIHALGYVLRPPNDAQ
jgi:DNA-binding response OmpR family regulator